DPRPVPARPGPGAPHRSGWRAHGHGRAAAGAARPQRHHVLRLGSARPAVRAERSGAGRGAGPPGGDRHRQRAPLPRGPDRQPLERNGLGRRVVETWAPSLASAGCRLVLELGAPIRGTWDARRLERVLDSLLSNAVKFGPGAPIEVQTGMRPGEAWLSVR